MTEFVNAVELWKLLVGALVFTVTTIGGGVVWIGKRIRAVSSDVAQEALAPHAETVSRVSAVERGLAEVSQDVKVLRDDHGAALRRMSRIEASMENVATKADVADLYKAFVEFRGSSQAEIRQLSGMTHSIHQAVLRASRSEK